MFVQMLDRYILEKPNCFGLRRPSRWYDHEGVETLYARGARAVVVAALRSVQTPVVMMTRAHPGLESEGHFAIAVTGAACGQAF